MNIEPPRSLILPFIMVFLICSLVVGGLYYVTVFVLQPVSYAEFNGCGHTQEGTCEYYNCMAGNVVNNQEAIKYELRYANLCVRQNEVTIKDEVLRGVK